MKRLGKLFNLSLKDTIAHHATNLELEGGWQQWTIQAYLITSRLYQCGILPQILDKMGECSELQCLTDRNVESRAPSYMITNPGCLQCATNPIQPFQLGSGDVTSLQPVPEEGDPETHPQLLCKNHG